MDEEVNSWIRRTNFSHTVCHRLDSSRLASIPLTYRAERAAASSSYGLKSRPYMSSSSSSSSSSSLSSLDQNHQKKKQPPKVRPNPMATKQRSLSPHPETKLSETFIEAKSNRKRFSTPEPRRIASERGFRPKKWLNSHSSSSFTSTSSPLRHLASMIHHGNEKSSSSSSLLFLRGRKYFEANGGRVSAVEEADGWTVDMSKLFLGNKFAHGAHSRLYHGMYDGVAVAVKIISLPDENNDNEISRSLMAAKLEREFVTEVSLLGRLRHDNVIKLVAACRNTPIYCVITEYLAEGSLRAYLHRREREPLPFGKLIGFALDIARGMEFVHSQGVIHRDLKPENVLIDKEFRMKIADFGTACDEACCDSLVDDPGTYRWMAPEMIKHKPYGRKVDVYSFGLILWEMVAGTIPYEEMNPIQAAFAVVNKNSRPVIPGNCPPAMRALIEQCWSLQPEKRPEFWQVVKVLEQFEASFACDGVLSLANNPCCQDPKKGLLRWVQKLSPANPNATPMPKPKFH